MKKRILLIFMIMLFGGLVSGCGVKKITLTWAVFNLRGDQQVYQEALNEALEEKKLPYQIHFVDIQVSFSGNYKEYVDTYLKEIEKNEFDIVSCPGQQNCYDTYHMMADDGLLVPLDDFMENEEAGKKLKAAYPSVALKAAKYRGNIYGIPMTRTELNYYAVFHVGCAEKYGIDLSTVRFSELESYFRKVKEEEKDNGEGFVISTPWQYFPWAGYENSPCELVCIRENNGKWTAESILDNQEGQKQLRLLNSWGKQGFIACSDYVETVTSGNFLAVASGYSYSGKAAENQVRNDFFISSDIELQAVEFPEFRLKFRGNGFKVGIGTRSGHKKEAMEAITAIYSDKDLSNALVYGKEGNSYQIEDGLAVVSEPYRLMETQRKINFENPFLTMPSYKESIDKNEKIWKLAEESESSGLLTFSFDLEGIDEAVCKLNTLLLEEYADLISGKSMDVETDLKALSEEADRLGLGFVLEKMNQQLEGF